MSKVKGRGFATETYAKVLYELEEFESEHPGVADKYSAINQALYALEYYPPGGPDYGVNLGELCERLETAATTLKELGQKHSDLKHAVAMAKIDYDKMVKSP